MLIFRFIVLSTLAVLGVGCSAGRQEPRVVETVKVEQPAKALTASVPNDPAKPKAECCEVAKPDEPAPGSQAPKLEAISGGLTIPDVTLIDQNGEPVNVGRDLARGKLLVLNFIFTTCKGVCPPMGVNFGHLRERLGDRLGRDVSLVSISVDPVTDTPERLKAWSDQFGGSSGWTLLTGPKPDVDRLLKALGVFAADKSNHSPFILLGRESTGIWQRVHGLTPADKLVEIILGLLDPPAADPKAPASAARRYFTDVPLTNQHGETMRLYSDLIKGKVVVITPFFTSCHGSCPRLIDTFSKLQTHFKDRLGKDLVLISLTVDPATDTPEKLSAYAGQYHALPGWYFLTGDKTNLDTALSKLGLRVDVREDHSNVFLIGNETTGLWKKAMGLAAPEEIVKIVESVLNDRPS